MRFSITEEFSIRDNPLIKRYFYEQFRKEIFSRSVFAYLLILFTLTLYCFLVYPMMSERPKDSVKIFHFCVLAMQFLMVFAMGLNNCVLSIVKEKEQKTHEFFKTLPMQYKDILVGKLFGPNLILHFLQIPTLALSFVSGLACGFHLKSILYVYYILFLGGATLQIAALFLSTFLKKQASSNLFIVFIILTGFSWIAGGVLLVYENKPIPPLYLFGQRIPLILYFTLMCVFLTKVFSLGTLQKLRNEQASPFTRTHALAIFAVFYFLTMISTKETSDFLATLTLFMFPGKNIILFFLCVALTPDYAAALAWLKKQKSSSENFIKDGMYNAGSPPHVFAGLCYLFSMLFCVFLIAIDPSKISTEYMSNPRLGMLFFHNFLLLILFLTIFQYGCLLNKHDSYSTGAKTLMISIVVILVILPETFNIFTSLFVAAMDFSKKPDTFSAEVYRKGMQSITYSVLLCTLSLYLLHLKYKYMGKVHEDEVLHI